MKIIFGVQDPWWANVSPEETGIGGSEEANLYLRRELIALGHDVIISDCLDEPCDVFVSWRNSFRYNPNAKKNYLHCHDIAVEPHWNSDALSHFDKIIFLNEHHRSCYGVPPERAFVASNGVDLAQFDRAVGRKPGKCIYFSHPHRGLDKLRAYWTKIRMEVPTATLYAFWWQPEFFLPPNESIGIMPMRNLGHMELAKEILSADLLVYPSIFSPEINPITCIKSQVGGAIPVTVNCGGMADTLIAPYYFDTYQNSFADKVITMLHESAQGRWDTLRKDMMREARERFDWKRIARVWEAEFLS